MIKITTKGDYSRTTKFLNYVSDGKYLLHILEKYGDKGVEALSAATPKDTGVTADSWSYTLRIEPGLCSITWSNSATTPGPKNHIPIVLLLQYGHATRNHGYVLPKDFINPAMKKIFEDIGKSAWEEVTNA